MLGFLLCNDPREVYRVHLSGNKLVFTVRDTLVDDIFETVTRKEAIDEFKKIPYTREGKVFYFSVSLPFITFPNYAHKGIDWEVLGVCAQQVALLLWFFNLYLGPYVYDPKYCLSEEPQLVVLATGYSKERDMHACPMEIGFSEMIARLLKEKFQKQTTVHVAIAEGADVYLKLTEKTKKSFEKEKKYFKRYCGGMATVVAYVRDCGVPQFSVPGDCACLGENPDSFKHVREMFSHNLDSTLQQMTMIVTVTAFWNSFLKPLYQESLV